MIINPLGMTKATIQIGNTKLFLYEIGGHLTIMDNNAGGHLLRYKKGSLQFRINKGMKLKHAIKDLILKAKGSTTEIILIDMND